MKVLTRVGKPLKKSELIAKVTTGSNTDLTPGRAEEALEYAVSKKGMIMETENGFRPT